MLPPENDHAELQNVDDGISKPFDIESLAKDGKEVPGDSRDHAHYRIRIDKTFYVVPTRKISGTQLLALAGKTPASHWLDQKVSGGTIERIGAADIVDLARKGVERFMTIALTETDGCHFALPSFSESR